MKSFFEKHQLLFSIILIVFYLVVNSICINNFGMTDIRTSIINIVLSIIILIFWKTIGLQNPRETIGSKGY